MIKKLAFSVFLAILNLGLFSQQQAIDLTFKAEYDGAYTLLDSVRVMNRTNHKDTLICWPDTSISYIINPGDLLLLIGYATSTTGVQNVPGELSSFELRQNYPNPLNDMSEISMYIPRTGTVNMTITDLQGKVIFRTDRQFDRGLHSFRFLPGESNFYVLTAYWNGMTRSIKMLTTGTNEDQGCVLDYVGTISGVPVLKNSREDNYYFNRQSGIVDTPEENTTYTFQFAKRIPCPGMPAVEYDGQVYNTIQIFSQCWLKENLNVGEMINGAMEQSDNGIIEKFCYNNEPENCTDHGGLYQWQEMMQYTAEEGVRGICPPGWHVPMDEEWKVLEGAVDSEYGIGSFMWDYEGSQGYDVGTNVKATIGWSGSGSGLDLFFFSALPAGGRTMVNYFHGKGTTGTWLTSTEIDAENAWGHYIYGFQPVIYHEPMLKNNAYSVRCLRDL